MNKEKRLTEKNNMVAYRNGVVDERGALMLEAIALLGLMTMMSPMIIRQTADRTAEMEEVAIAGQMKEIKEALSNWIEANYQEKAKEISESTTPTAQSFSVTASQLAPYLPATYLTNDGNFKGNKLADGFEVGVRAQCTESNKKDGSGSCNDESTWANGTISSLGANCSCSRYKMTGVVLSKSDNNTEIDDRRAARIASMIGADGGYMRTEKMVSSFAEENKVAEMKKILGSQGIWEGNVDDYFPPDTITTGGRIAATTIYSSGFSGDFLYRKKVDGLPGANSMFTDLDMGGATNCSGDGCHKINNAGGLEVIGGKILIRSANNIAGTNDQEVDSNTLVSLAQDDSFIHVSNGFNVTSNGNSSFTMTPGDLNYVSTENRYQQLTLNSNGLVMQTGSDANGGGKMSWVTMDPDSASFSVANGSYSFYVDDTYEKNMGMEALYGNIVVNANSGNINLESGENIDAFANQDMILSSGNTTTLYAGTTTNVLAGNEIIVSVQNANNTTYDARTPSLKLEEDTFKLQSETTRIKGYANIIEMGVAVGNTSSNNAMASFESDRITGVQANASTVVAGVNLPSAAVTPDTNTPAYWSLNSNQYQLSFRPDDNTQNELTVFSNGHLMLTSNNTSSNTNGLSAYLGSVYTNRLKVYAYDNGIMVPQTPSNIQSAEVIVNTAAATSGGPQAYNYHSADATKYKEYRVDPSFISVMNDIKLTSRGGARLSETIPNYILKGIYELSNSYGSGPWPCDSRSSLSTTQNCSWAAPYFTLKEMGLSSGGWDHNCDSSSHPIRSAGGSCSQSRDVVRFNYYKANTYTECRGDTYCWAHPFMGKVPAPGKTVSYAYSGGTETLSAKDEGYCPDGYQAVITVTPIIFDLGRVSFYNHYARAENSMITYNPGWQDFTNESIRDVTGIFQPGTKIGIYVEQELENNELKGWKIAMGTVTPTSLSSTGYIWNVSGVTANSWSAIAHTYCYFNPGRFDMPNMQLDNNNVIVSTERSGW